MYSGLGSSSERCKELPLMGYSSSGLGCLTVYQEIQGFESPITRHLSFGVSKCSTYDNKLGKYVRLVDLKTFMGL